MIRLPLLVGFAVSLLLTRPAGEGADAPALQDGRAYYAAPDGRPGARGTEEDPLNLASALSRRGPVGPGDTVWLLPGTYSGSVTSTVEGTAVQPVVVRGVSPKRTMFDARGSRSSPLIIRGSWTVFRDFEIMNSDARRSVSEAGSRAVDTWRRDGVVVYGAHTRLINLTIRDNADGIALWGPARSAEVYGCLVFNNGWIGPDRGHGHGLYIQSSEDTKQVREVISFNNFATGMKAYAERGRVDGVRFDGVVSFNNGAPAAGEGSGRMPNVFVGPTSAPAGTVSVTDSFLFHPPGTITELGGNLALGFTASGNGTAIVRGSYVAGGHRALFLRDWRSVIVEDNTFATSGDGAPDEHPRLAGLEKIDGADRDEIVWNRNRYLAIRDSRDARQSDQQFSPGGGRVDFEEWRKRTGFDGSSDYAPAAPEQAEVFVRPNAHERGRAHVIVLNWPSADAVTVTLAAANLRFGEPFEVHDVQNLRGDPVVSGHYDGSAVRLPLTGRAVDAPIGTPAPTHTGPGFAVFLVRPISHDVHDSGAR